MKKIVIVTDKSEFDQSLLTWLNTLFPDNEIHIVFKEVDILGESLAGRSSGLFTPYTIGSP